MKYLICSVLMAALIFTVCNWASGWRIFEVEAALALGLVSLFGGLLSCVSLIPPSKD